MSDIFGQDGNGKNTAWKLNEEKTLRIRIETFLPNKDLFTIPETAAYFQVKTRTIYRWIKIGQLEKVKIQGSSRIKRESILNSHNMSQ